MSTPSVPVKVPGLSTPHPPPTQTGSIPFAFPPLSLTGTTTFWLWGTLSPTSVPLIILHGGPGIPHNYLLPLSHISTLYSIPVLIYDQIGCGKSTRFPSKRGDASFWTPELFMAELDNMIAHFNITQYDLLGHSWGGMLGAQFAIERQPRGMRKLVIADSPPSMDLWVQSTGKLRREGLKTEVREVLDRCEREGNTASEEYENAVMEFYKLFLCRLETWPKVLEDSFDGLKEDSVVYETMNGPSEFHVVGNLRTWSVVDGLEKITQETCPGGVLLVNGYYDEAQDEIVEVFFQRIAAKVKWVGFALSSHTPHLEESEKFISTLGAFLTSSQSLPSSS